MEINNNHDYSKVCDCGWVPGPDGCINCRASNGQKIIIRTVQTNKNGDETLVDAQIHWVH